MYIPREVLLRVFEEMNFGDAERIDSLDSPIHWCLSASELQSRWIERMARARSAWNCSVLKLHLINKACHSLMSYRMRDSVIIEQLTTSDEPVHRLVPENREWTSKYKRVQVFATEGTSPENWKLLTDCHEMIESFHLEKGLTNMGTTLRPISFDQVDFPQLRSFTFRTSAPNEWMQYRDVVQLLRNSPQLEDLTIFQLQGPSDSEVLQLLKTQGSAASQLNSVHLRRLRSCTRMNLRFILSNSTQSLKEFTLVFDKANETPGSPRFHRGIRAREVRQALMFCTAIEKLRIADMVTDMSEYSPQNRIRPLDHEDNPLGFMSDDLVLTLKNLQELELCGTIFSMDMLDNLRDVGCKLRHLSIHRYYEFPVVRFINQLASNRALENLERLVIHQAATLTPEAWNLLSLLCHDRQIEFLHW